MTPPKVYLSVGRHQRYGCGDTAILRDDMPKAYLTGKMLRQLLPPCTAVYHSPLARAVETAQFTALGLQCSHLLEITALAEDTPKYEVQKFLNALWQNSDDSAAYYHLVTHLPVVEKLGLPFLGTGEVCLLSADSWADMLAENYTVQKLPLPEEAEALWLRFHLADGAWNNLTSAEIRQLLQNYQQKPKDS